MCNCNCKCKTGIAVKLISDGTAWGTKVVNAKTGELIRGVTKVEFVAEANGMPPRLRLEIADPEVELQGEAEVNSCTCQSDTVKPKS